jgi:hypothetical protein
MDKIDWKRKLSSRKFWTAIIAWITSLLTAFNVADGTVAQITLIISGIAALAVYMLAEAYTEKPAVVLEQSTETTESQETTETKTNLSADPPVRPACPAGRQAGQAGAIGFETEREGE